MHAYEMAYGERHAYEMAYGERHACERHSYKMAYERGMPMRRLL
jgi:hypothetical protein